MESFFKSHLAKFLAVGLSNTLISYLVFILCYSIILDKNALISQIFSYSAGIFWSYFLNKNWTFSDTRQGTKRTMLPFMLVQISLLCLSSVLVNYAVSNLSLNVNLIWIITMGCITVLNFVLTKYLVFSANAQGEICPPNNH